MPVTPTYPGVYIEEVPSGVHTITGVATSIGAFIDTFTRGPIDTAVQVLSMADFEREFGGLNTLSEGSYAIAQFFLNGGSQAWVVRVGTNGGRAEPARDRDRRPDRRGEPGRPGAGRQARPRHLGRSIRARGATSSGSRSTAMSPSPPTRPRPPLSSST